MLKILTSTQSATAFVVDEDRSCLWFTQADGSISSVPFSGGTSITHQTTASPVTGMGGNGRVLVLAHADGSVSTLDPDDPAAPIKIVAATKWAFGQTIISYAKSPTAAIVSRPRRRPLQHPSQWLLLQGKNESALALVELATGAISSVALEGLAGVAIDRAAVYVGLNKSFPQRGEVALLKGAFTKTLAFGLPPVGRIGVGENGAVLLACHPGAGQLTILRPGTGSSDTVSSSALPGTLLEAHGLANGRIAVLTSDVLAIIDHISELTQNPSIGPLTEPLFVGSWVELSFDLGTSGLTKDDVHFEVPDGPNAGFVSYARSNGVADPVPLLIAGGVIGIHKVVLVENTTANVLASAEFEITDHWTDEDTGPSGCYMTASSFDGGAWGGGPNTPQNMGVHPHNGTWRSLVLMVDTTSRRWPTDAPTMNTNRSDILGHVVNGVTFNGDTRSARHYYEENSRYVAPAGGNPARGLTLSARNNQAYGPVNLPGSWTDYFNQKKDKDGNVIDDR